MNADNIKKVIAVMERAALHPTKFYMVESLENYNNIKSEADLINSDGVTIDFISWLMLAPEIPVPVDDSMPEHTLADWIGVNAEHLLSITFGDESFERSLGKGWLYWTPDDMITIMNVWLAQGKSVSSW